MTTAPNAYSATVAVNKAGHAGATVAFALTAGSLPPGLSLAAPSGSGTAITGKPVKAGTFNFTVKATDGGLTSTLAYQITVTVQGPPDQLMCAAANGSFLISGVCALPDAVLGQPYQGYLATSHNAGGTLSVAAGALPPGLSLPATFGPSGATIGGTATQQGIEESPGEHASVPLDPRLLSTVPTSIRTRKAPRPAPPVAAPARPASRLTPRSAVQA
jgi:Putative Ig domain